MVRRSYGRGSNADDATLREQLIQLLGGGASGNGGARGGGRGGGGGGKGGGGGRGGGGNAASDRPQQSRPGDWECLQCRFINFGFRRTCLRCRPAAAGQPQRALSAAHTGALRPQSMARPIQRPATAAEARSAAARAGQPSFHVPRPAAAASATPTGGEPPLATQAQTDNDGTRTPACGGASGQPGSGAAAARGAAVQWAPSLQQGPAHTPSAHLECSEAVTNRNKRGRWADEVPPCDRMQDDADEEDSTYADDDAAHDDLLEDEGDACSDPPPSAETLRARWATECRIVKALEKVEWEIGQGQSAALYAAQRARDRAEHEWRSAVSPKPVATRMGAAQRKVNKAQRAVDRANAALQEFEDEAAQRRTELREAVRQAEDRRDQRQQELNELHKEAGAIAAAGAASGQAAAEGASASDKLLDEMVREVQAIVETMDEGSDARGRVNLLLARVATETEHARSTRCQRFEIGTDGEECADARSGSQADTRRGRDGRRTQGAASARREAVWNETAGGRWCRHKQEASDAAADDSKAEDATTAAASASSAAGATGAAAAATGTPQQAPSSAEGTAATQSRTARGAATHSGKGGRPAPNDHGDGQPPNKSHRGHDINGEVSVAVEGVCDDAARALKLMGEQEAAIRAAQAANATFGDDVSMQIAGQLYAHKVQLAVERAKAAGVQPEVGGVQLIQLPPDAFNKWIQEVLTPAEVARGEAEEKEL